jgi:hypothetical protein
MQRAIRSRDAIARPISSLPMVLDVGSTLGKAGIAREIFIVKGTFYAVLGHSIGISGDTERYVCGGGPVPVLGGGAEGFERNIR